MGRLSRMGISRSEPLHIEVSTAGDDPDGYGKSRYDYGKRVEAGSEDDPGFLFVAYEAPQDLSDAELDADPIKYGRMANPSWGHTVDEEEFLPDYQTSKKSLLELARFKMYRLDIRRHSVNPWLRIGDWAACAREFGPKDLAGKPCGAGLDLSQTDDMTALSLIFPEDISAWFAQLQRARREEQEAKEKGAEAAEAEAKRYARTDVPVRLLTWYWMPEEAIREHLAKLPPQFTRWVRDGWVVETPGRVMDYAVVEDSIAGICRQFDVRLMAYDERFAARTMQILAARNVVPAERQYAFTQASKTYTGPTTCFERLVIAGKLWHNGNPVTNWQAGSVHVDRRRNGSLMPIKPSKDSPQKIDGIVAGVMALDAAFRMTPPKRSVYMDRGVLSL